ncbi:MAG: hypothetical protein J0L92_12825, partial [Deltaproteobacteria bacterium]|nr:hypothetical protein [Deltaproteobacteria bacterium]
MHREGGEARRPTGPRLPAERPRALGRLAHAIVPVLVLLLGSSLAHAQPLLRDEALLATFGGVELDALSRPTWTGTHAITRDGRCVSGTSIVTPMTAPSAVWAHPSSGTFFTATSPFGGRTAIYRNDCAPSSVLVEDFAGLATTMRAAPLLGGALVSHGADLAVIAIPAPGGTLARVVLADAASVGATLPPLTGAGISEVEVAIGRLSASGEIDTIVFDAHRTWLETEPTGTEVRREEVWVLEVRVGAAPRARVGPFPVRGMHALATDVPIRLTTTRGPDHLVIETRDEVLLAPRDAEALDPSE